MARSKEGTAEERLREAGRRLFAEYGVAGLSTDRLAQEAQVSKATLYKYFGGKSELFAAIIDHDSRIFDIDPEQEYGSAEEFVEQVVNFGFALTRLLARLEVQNMGRAIINHAATDHDTAQLFFDRAIENARTRLAHLLADGVARGFIENAIPPRRLATYLLSVWKGVDDYRHLLLLKERPIAMTRSQVRECTVRLLGLH